MAITSTPVSTDLVLVMDYGTSSTGKAQSRERVIKSVSPTSNHEDVYAVAQIVLNLQERAHLAVQRRDVVELNDL